MYIVLEENWIPLFVPDDLRDRPTADTGVQAYSVDGVCSANVALKSPLHE